MRELTEKELYQALQFAKSIDEATGGKMLEQFELEQPAFAQTLFAVFPSVIAEQDQNLAHLFMDCCFDIICVYQHAFGQLPDQKTLGFDWLEKNAVLLDAELQAMMSGKMEQKFRHKLQERFTERLIDSNAQTGLVQFLNATVDDYTSEQPATQAAIKTTKTMLFVVVQLFSSLYRHALSDGK